MTKTMIWFGAFFALFGLIFAAVGAVFFWTDRELAAAGERAAGTVVGFDTSRDSDGDTTYRAQVIYTDNNGQQQRFTSKVGTSPPSFDQGETVQVIYDPWSPQNATVDSFGQRTLFPLVFGGVGLLFAAIGFGVMSRAIWRKRMVARLRHSGLPIDAEFLECYYDSSVKVNGRSPWRVVAQAVHPGSGKLQVFKSDAIWANPTAMLQGKRVRVLVDHANPKHYWVDLDRYLDDSARG